MPRKGVSPETVDTVVKQLARMTAFVTTGMKNARAAVRLARVVSPLGAGPAARAKIAAVALLMPVKKRLGSTRQRPVTLHVEKFGKTVQCAVRQRCDLLVLHEVFRVDAYDVPELADPEVILDLGSNIGVSVLYFHAKYPNASIYAFEPDPLTFELLELNTRTLPNVHVQRLAVTDRDGAVDFFHAEQSFASSLRPVDGTHSSAVVQGRRLDTLINELGLQRVDLLKVDIEGAELEVFAASRELERVGVIIGELHVDLMDGELEEVLRPLDGFDVHAEYQEIPSMPLAERYHLLARRREPARERAV